MYLQGFLAGLTVFLLYLTRGEAAVDQDWSLFLLENLAFKD